MIDFKNEKQMLKALDYVRERVNNFYLSNEYNQAWDRYVKRWKAYHRRPENNKPVWRSQLYFATFFVAVNALIARFKAAHATDPMIFVGLKDNSNVDIEATAKALVQHQDLNYDLHISGFKKKIFDMYYYVGIFSTACAREYIRTKQSFEQKKKRAKNQFNIDLGTEETETVERSEYTATQVIHPLNFGHDITKNSFGESSWGSVRFELEATELYKMLDNPNYYQPGVKKVIEEWENGDGLGYTVGTTTFYSERGNDDKGQRKSTLIVNEYSGPIKFPGNRDDDTHYIVLYVKSTNSILQMMPSKFVGHPYWKMMTYPEADGPFGLGANDPLLPIADWKNNTVNQYNDYTNAALKFMSEVQPENIVGGINTLINGLPNGFLPLESGIAPGQSVRGLELSKNAVQSVESNLQQIQAAEEQYGMSSNLRGKQGGSNADTATGIQLLADREDDNIASIQDSIDMGIKRGISIKVRNQQKLFNEPKNAQIVLNGEDLIIPHYPYDLAGEDFTYDIKRELGDVEAGKNMSFLRLIMEIDNQMSAKGTPLPPDVLIDTVGKVGTALNVDGIDQIIEKLKQTATAPTPQPEALGAGQPQGAGNAAMALA